MFCVTHDLSKALNMLLWSLGSDRMFLSWKASGSFNSMQPTLELKRWRLTNTLLNNPWDLERLLRSGVISVPCPGHTLPSQAFPSSCLGSAGKELTPTFPFPPPSICWEAMSAMLGITHYTFT